jgi:hypothetical protein
MDDAESLGNVAVRAARVALLDRDHVRPLTDYVNELRERSGLVERVPYFDPLDGGVRARCLCLLLAPGPVAKETGFVSRDNPDPTARSFRSFMRDVGLDRSDTVVWNIVPWYLGDAKKIKPPKAADKRRGKEHLLDLLGKLVHLKVVVLFGNAALEARLLLEDQRRDLGLRHCAHPSPVVKAFFHAKWAEIPIVLRSGGVSVRLALGPGLVQ